MAFHAIRVKTDNYNFVLDFRAVCVPPPRVTRPPSVKLHQKRSFNQSFSSTLSDGSECTLKFILGSVFFGIQIHAKIYLLTYLLRGKITEINFEYLSKNQIFYTRPISILAHFVAIQKRKLKLQPHLILTN